jgi:ABC-type glutathione transport system ATPase component
MSCVPARDGARVFRVRDLTKIYGEGLARVHALAGVDLDLYAGELVVLLGPSGSGKEAAKRDGEVATPRAERSDVR